MENGALHHQQKTSLWKILGNILGIGVVISILGIAFYWYEFRPSAIRQECEAFTNSQNSYDNAEANDFYRICLLRKGLKPENMYVNTD